MSSHGLPTTPRYRSAPQARLSVVTILRELAPASLEHWQHTASEKSRDVCVCPFCHHIRARTKDTGTFHVHQDDNLWKCFACGEKGNAWQLRDKLTYGSNGSSNGAALSPPRTPPPRPSAPERVTLDGATLRELALVKGLDAAWLSNSLKWRDGSWFGTPAVLIPYYDFEGKALPVRYRVGIAGAQRFRWQKGAQPILYGLQNWPEIKQNDMVVLSEGETNTASLLRNGYTALGIPGAAAYKHEWDVHLKALTWVYVWEDPDEAGAKLTAELRKGIPQLRVIKAPPNIKGPNDLHQIMPNIPDFQAVMKELLSLADAEFEAARRQPEGYCCKEGEPPPNSNNPPVGASPEAEEYLAERKKELGAYYRRAGRGFEADNLDQCKKRCLRKRCQTTGTIFRELIHCHDPNCWECSLERLNQFFQSKAKLLKEHLENPALYRVPLHYTLDPITDRGDQIKAITKGIARMLTHLGKQESDLDLMKHHARSAPVEMEGDSYLVTLTFLGESDPTAVKILSDFFTGAMGTPVSAIERICHGINDMIDQAARSLAVRCRWDTVDNYLAWREGAAKTHQIQGKGKFHSVTGSKAKKERPDPGAACPLCGECKPEILGRVDATDGETRTYTCQVTGRLVTVEIDPGGDPGVA